MTGRRVRIGAVSYLNTRPLVFGLERGLLPDGAELSYAPPAVLADRLAAGDLDVGLIPVVELARIPDLEIAPGLGIVGRGPTRSVLLVSRVPLDDVRTVALDPESRTSNALVRVLFDRVWPGRPTFLPGPGDLGDALGRADAAVRIGDKALFEPVPDGHEVHDLGAAWTATTGLPFVFAVWACRYGALDRGLYRAPHASLREGLRRIDDIARDWTWRGEHRTAIARRYLREHIRFRLGSDELRALRAFLADAARIGIVPRAPEVRMAFERRTNCHVRAEALSTEERR